MFFDTPLYPRLSSDAGNCAGYCQQKVVKLDS
jgi:hypothetical protein